MSLPIGTSQLTALGITPKLPSVATEAQNYVSPALLGIASVPGMPLRDASGPAMPKKQGVLDGYRLDMETIEDTFEKAIAQYNYPYADGADLEDMGQKAHKLRMKCYFFDNAEQQTYNYHIDLLNSLCLKDLIDLVHPKYGLMKVKIESIAVQHDDRERCAVLDISFIEQMRGYIEPTKNTSVLSYAEVSYLEGMEQQLLNLVTDIKNALPDVDTGVLSKVLNAGQGLLEQVQGYSNKTRAFVGSVEGYIAIAEAVVNQIVSPVNSLQATITYAQNLPGKILSSLAVVAEKITLPSASLKNTPKIFLSTVEAAFTDLQTSFADFGDTSAGAQRLSLQGKEAAEIMNKHLEIIIVQRLTLEAAALYAADEEAAQDGDTDFQLMNMFELEKTLAIVRARLEAAENSNRDMYGFKSSAENLLNHVNRIRLQREKMIKVVLDNHMPLHLVCLKYGLPYKDAERLLRINRIRQPNFTNGEVLVYARQS